MFFSYVSVLPFVLPQWKKYSFIIKRWYFETIFYSSFCVCEKNTRNFSLVQNSAAGYRSVDKYYRTKYIFSSVFLCSKTAFLRERFVKTEKCFLSRSDCWSRRIHKILFFVAICFIVNQKKISIFFAPSKEKEVFRCNSWIILLQKWGKVF